MPAWVNTEGRVDVAPVREAVLEAISLGHVQWAAIARELGYYRNDRGGCRYADSSRVKMMLGIKPTRDKRYCQAYYAKTIRVELVERICEIIDVMPVEVGL